MADGESRSTMAVGVLVGLALGVAVMGGLMGIGGYAWVKRAENRVKRGWNLVPVTVATRDLAPGKPLAETDLATREIPEQFITSSVVKPDSVSYVLREPLLVPMKAGQPLQWAFVQETPDGEIPTTEEQAAARECMAAVLAQPGTARTPETVELLHATLVGPGGAR